MVSNKKDGKRVVLQDQQGVPVASSTIEMDKGDDKRKTPQRHHLHDIVPEDKEGNLKDWTDNDEALREGIIIDVHKEEGRHDNSRRGKQAGEGDVQGSRNKDSFIVESEGV